LIKAGRSDVCQNFAMSLDLLLLLYGIQWVIFCWFLKSLFKRQAWLYR